MDISERKRVVLAAVISLHTRLGEPVGSKNLMSFIDAFSVSSATLRNEMAQLTDMGLLEQPHTSAGRVPTVEGYRYFIDNLMPARKLSEAERDSINKQISEMDTDPDKAAQEAARALSKMTGLVSIATTPKGRDMHIVHYELVRVGRYSIAVLAVTSAGGVRSRVCRTAAEMSNSELENTENSLNRKLVFVSDGVISRESAVELAQELGGAATPIVDAAVEILKGLTEVSVYTVGQQYLLSYPELDSCMKDILELFSRTDEMRARFEQTSEPVAVFVGDELGGGLSEMSLVVAHYRASGGLRGGLGVAGPVRMDYQFVVPRLSYFCKKISETLTAAR